MINIIILEIFLSSAFIYGTPRVRCIDNAIEEITVGRASATTVRRVAAVISFAGVFMKCPKLFEKGIIPYFSDTIQKYIQNQKGR